MPENKKKEFFDAEMTCHLLKEQSITHGNYIQSLRFDIWAMQDSIITIKWLLGITMVTLLGTIIAIM